MLRDRGATGAAAGCSGTPQEDRQPKWDRLQRQGAAGLQALLAGAFRQVADQDDAWAHAGKVVQRCQSARMPFSSGRRARSASQRRATAREGFRAGALLQPGFANISQAASSWLQGVLGGGREVPPAQPAELAVSGRPRGLQPLWSLAAAPDADGSQGVADEGGGGDEAAADDERILISEVEVRGAPLELQRIAERALTTKPNFAYTLKEIQDDVGRVFDTGYFSKAAPTAEDTRDGVKLTVEVTANPELRGLVAHGADVLPASIIQDAFGDQYGRTLNFKNFKRALQQLNKWYEERGFFGEVVGVEMEDGVAEVRLAEAQVQRLQLRYVDPGTGESREEGVTKPEVILRQLCTTPGQVYNLRQARRDIDAVYSMGLFEDVNILPQPSDDSTDDMPKLDLTLNVEERKTGGFSAGGGISGAGHAEGALPGFIGSCAYSQRNLFGLNQKLTASVELGQVDSLFRVVHTDPWLAGDPYRTSRTTSLQNTRTSGNPIHGKAQDDTSIRPHGSDEASGGDGNVVVARMVAGVEYGRPLAQGWSGVLGVNWLRAKCLGDHGSPLRSDCYGAPLTFSGGNSDTMALALLRAVYGGVGDGALVLSMEQAVPLKPEWLNFNRFRVRGERTVPLGPLQLVLCGKGGVIFGDLPPYEAFPIGGTNSVRGYSEGGVGSGRKYVAGTAEVHWPLIGPLEGTVFADYGSDLDSGASVLGDPAGVRGKPGNGYGYGAGVRIDSPVGPLRLEYAFNDHGFRRFHLGIGSHG